MAYTLWKQSLQLGNPLQIVDTYLRSKFVYMAENIETLQTPEYMLKGLETSNQLTGDCDDISILHAALLQCMNIPVRFVAIRSVLENPNFDHVYIEAFDGTEWLSFDVTLPSGLDINYFGRLTIQV